MGPLLPEGQDLFTVEDLAEAFKVSGMTIYRLANSGEMPSLRIGGSLRFERKDIEAYLRQAKIPKAARKKTAKKAVKKAVKKSAKRG